MYSSSARKTDSHFPDIQRDMTISAGEYMETVSRERRNLTTEEADVPAWRREAIGRLKELVRLEPNWNSYGARLVSARLADTTLQILESLMRETTPRPSIVPTPAGRIQLEWHTKGIDLEVEIASPILLRVAFEDNQTGEEWEQDFNVDLRRLDEVVSKLSQR